MLTHHHHHHHLAQSVAHRCSRAVLARRSSRPYPHALMILVLVLVPLLPARTLRIPRISMSRIRRLRGTIRMWKWRCLDFGLGVCVCILVSTLLGWVLIRMTVCCVVMVMVLVHVVYWL